jgi:hypothetical protein
MSRGHHSYHEYAREFHLLLLPLGCSIVLRFEESGHYFSYFDFLIQYLLGMSKCHIWDPCVAQKAMHAIMTTESLPCSNRGLIFDATNLDNYIGSELTPTFPRCCLFSCLKIACDACASRNVIIHYVAQLPAPLRSSHIHLGDWTLESHHPLDILLSHKTHFQQKYELLSMICSNKRQARKGKYFTVVSSSCSGHQHLISSRRVCHESPSSTSGTTVS